MAKKIVKIFGIIFLVLGVWGFFQDMILGIFAVNLWHNLVHLLSGIVALMAARSDGGARAFAKWFGIIYLVVAVLGFFSGDMILGFIANNGADNILHLLIAIVLLLAAFRKGSPSPENVMESSQMNQTMGQNTGAMNSNSGPDADQGSPQA